VQDRRKGLLQDDCVAVSIAVHTLHEREEQTFTNMLSVSPSSSLSSLTLGVVLGLDDGGLHKKARAVNDAAAGENVAALRDRGLDRLVGSERGGEEREREREREREKERKQQHTHTHTHTHTSE
jgi:hypothetical protein